jgi:hypothetical protein
MFSLSLWALVGCGDDAASAAGKPDAGQDAGEGSADSCEVASDCTLIAKGCCGSCEPTKADVVAVLSSKATQEVENRCPGPDPACGPCEVKVYDPEAPALHAGCEAGACVVLDLREADVSTCTKDEDCEVASQGCCEACTADPRAWLALKKGAENPTAVACEGVACDACVAVIKPEPFCADDGHCALRDRPAVDAVPSASCFSPAQNLEKAYANGAVGCDCFDVSASVCVKDVADHAVALICHEDGHWGAVEDGPCFPGGA